MSDNPTTVALISDKAMFEARKYIVEEARYPVSDDPASAPSVAGILTRLKGLHRFHLNTTWAARNGLANSTDTRVYGTLRIDPDTLTVSGDLHADIRRFAWLASWRSDALFQIDVPNRLRAEDWNANGWNLFTIGEVARADTTDDGGGSVALALRVNANDRIEAVRLIEFRPRGQIRRDLTKTGPVETAPHPAYRQLRPIHLVDRGILAEQVLREVLEHALGTDGKAIEEALRTSGAGLVWQDGTVSLQTATGGSSAFELLTPHQWTDDPYSYAVLFSSQNDTRFGTVLELEKEQTPLAKVRFGAVIFLRPIIKASLAAAGSTNVAAQMGAIAKRIQTTYIHEIGHILNLPHTWQRGRFVEPAIPSNPAARSWMTYGSRFPLGDFMTVSRKQLADGDETKEASLLLEDATRANADALRSPHFSARETAWLRHAPFDYISPGGPYFTSRDAGPSRLHQPSSEDDISLRVELWDQQAADPDGAMIFARGTHHLFPWQPLFGQVVLRVPEHLPRQFPFLFAFQSPMLSLVLREEYPDQRDRDIPRRVLEVPAAPLSSTWRERRPDGLLGPADLPEFFHANAIKALPEDIPGPNGTLTEYRRFTPFFSPFEFSQAFTERGCTDYTMQAVLRPVGRSPIFSERVIIRFRYLYKYFSDSQAAILSDPILASYIDAISYFQHDKNVAMLEAPDLHSVQPQDFRNLFRDLVERIASLDSVEPVSEELFNFLRAYEWSRIFLIERAAPLFAPRFDDRLLRLLQQSMQSDPERFQVLRRKVTATK